MRSDFLHQRRGRRVPSVQHIGVHDLAATLKVSEVHANGLKGSSPVYGMKWSAHFVNLRGSQHGQRHWEYHILVRPTAENDLRPEGSPLPQATWRVPPQHVEKRLSIGTDLVWQRIATLAFILFALVYLLAVARRTTDPDTFLGAHVKSLGLLALGQAALAVIYRRISTVVEQPLGLGALQRKLPFPEATPVKFEVVHRGTVTGSDEGFLWFSHDVLHFRGLYTAFRVARHDLPPLAMWPRHMRPREVISESRTLPVPGHENEKVMRFTFIDPFEDYDARRRALRADRAIKEWMVSVPKGEAESLLPPLRLHPAFERDQALNRQGFVVCAALTCLDFVLLVTTPYGSGLFQSQPAVAFLNAAVLGTLTLAMAFVTWLELRDLRNRRAVSPRLDVTA